MENSGDVVSSSTPAGVGTENRTPGGFERLLGWVGMAGKAKSPPPAPVVEVVESPTTAAGQPPPAGSVQAGHSAVAGAALPSPAPPSGSGIPAAATAGRGLADRASGALPLGVKSVAAGHFLGGMLPAEPTDAVSSMGLAGGGVVVQSPLAATELPLARRRRVPSASRTGSVSRRAKSDKEPKGKKNKMDKRSGVVSVAAAAGGMASQPGAAAADPPGGSRGRSPSAPQAGSSSRRAKEDKEHKSRKAKDKHKRRSKVEDTKSVQSVSEDAPPGTRFGRRRGRSSRR